MDSSKDINQNTWNNIKMFTGNMLKRMQINEDTVQVSLILFGERASIQIIDSNAAQSLKNLKRITGEKRMDLAFELAEKTIGDFDTINTRNAILLVTEVVDSGISTFDLLNEKVKTMKLNGIDVYTMLMNDKKSSLDDYLQLASKPVENHVFVSSPTDITKWSTTVAKSICRRNI